MIRTPFKVSFLSLWLLVAALVVSCSSAFAPVRSSNSNLARLVNTPFLFRQATRSFLSNEDESETPEEQKPPPIIETEPVSTGTEYPIDLPSPILLATSMILAIASTGSVFELAGGNPQYGFEVTASVAAIGIPLCLFLFYAAILKGTAETEEDDKAFTKSGKF